MIDPKVKGILMTHFDKFSVFGVFANQPTVHSSQLYPIQPWPCPCFPSINGYNRLNQKRHGLLQHQILNGGPPPPLLTRLDTWRAICNQIPD